MIDKSIINHYIQIKILIFTLIMILLERILQRNNK